MKNRCCKKLAAALAACLAALLAGAQTWTVSAPRAWSRTENAVTLKTGADGAMELRHTGGQDWSINCTAPIDVKPGDAFRFSCASRALSDVPAPGRYSLGAILRDANGNAMKWALGRRSAKAGDPVSTEFVVPPGGARIEPRVTGHGPAGVAVRDFKVEFLGNRMPKDLAPRPDVVAETVHLRVVVSGKDAALSVTDKRTGRVWAPSPAPERQFVVTALSRSGRAICATAVDLASLRTWGFVVAPSPERPEVLVTVTGEGEMPVALDWPQAFATRPGDRLVVPMNEGISYPVTEPDGIPARLIAYGGHGICMAFFGVQDDATGAGYMGVIETPDDAAATFRRPAGDEPFAAGVSWEAQKGRFGYARRLRCVFFDKGGHVAMCKRYRAYAKEKGTLKTFAEKVKDRPSVDRLLGAANIWCWDGDKVGMAKKFKEAGIDRFLWSVAGNAGQVAALARMEGVLVGRYDVYRDIYHPDQLRKLGKKEGKNMEAWPDGVAWNSADPDDWRKAWAVRAKDGTMTFCACMCDAVSAKYCRKHVGEELKTHPYTARFVDVSTAASWDVCWNPAHPMTRSDSRAYRMDLLRLLGDDFGLVVGSETGHDAAVPYCDYFEGMLSLVDYRVPDSGNNTGKIWTNVPPRVAKFQVGAAYRLPLWELVYHDCLCAHWYWGDYNNKLPALWDRRDLFNVLYGTMGMYFFDRTQWEEKKDRFVRSYRITSPVARKTGYSEMLDHRILSADRLVQRTAFADGTVVTVNFGDKPFALPEGGELAAGGYLVK